MNFGHSCVQAYINGFLLFLTLAVPQVVHAQLKGGHTVVLITDQEKYSLEFHVNTGTDISPRLVLSQGFYNVDSQCGRVLYFDTYSKLFSTKFFGDTVFNGGLSAFNSLIKDIQNVKLDSLKLDHISDSLQTEVHLKYEIPKKMKLFIRACDNKFEQPDFGSYILIENGYSKVYLYDNLVAVGKISKDGNLNTSHNRERSIRKGIIYVGNGKYKLLKCFMFLDMHNLCLFE